ncbi:MAG TPA: nitrate- and nitrite sensing domain-containing protein [Pseudonocardiaceae bacterium]|nr:nitrate- and nitrite sensing domain-containing protein [Pseudonocardiaceae bacterium]
MPKRRFMWRRANRAESIKKRVIRVALIPSVALILLWLAAALYLGGTGFYDQQVASGVRSVSIPAVTGLASVEKERQLSMAYLAAPHVDLQPLLAQQKLSDQGLSSMQTAAGSVLAHAPQTLVDRFGALSKYIDQLPNIRGRIDAGVATTAEVSSFYNGLLDSATDLFGTQARVVPDAAVVPGAIAATNIFHISDLMSRAGSLISGALAANRLNQGDYLQFTNLVGAYHALLGTTKGDLRPDVQAQYQKLSATKSWQQLVAAENAIISHGPWTNGVPQGVPSTATWQNLTNAVSAGLANMTITQADQVSAQALSDGNTQLLQLGIALVVALLVVIGSIWWARRQSTVLVDSALVTRLTKLRMDAQDLVGARLPELVSRLRSGDSVDPEEQLPELHYGQGDEIEQVATAISAALREAVTAAAGEAQARNALNTVFRGIARRNQLPLYNLLSLLDSLEQTEQDSTALERLYRLDHEATRARRNSENLIILSGGDLGHHLPGPVRMRDVLRSAISETHEYQRVKLKGQVPDVAIASDAVTGLIHLIAELLENAARFSPPSYEVLVRSMPAQAGVIVEVEDRGLGIPTDRRERVNSMLAKPPEVDVMAIGDGSQLGFWVIASLVKRFGFKVALRESDYGGILAIVRVPNHLVVTESTPETPQQNGTNGGYHGRDVFRSLAARESERLIPEVTAEETTMVIPRITVATAERDPDPDPTPLVGETTKRASRRSTSTGHWFVDTPAEPAVTQISGDDLRTTWPTGPEETKSSSRAPLPQRSPGDHLNPRLTYEAVEVDGPDDDDAAESARDVGTALSAFQQGSEAGRLAGDS